MAERASARSRLSGAVAVTVLVALAELALLTAVYHLGDGLDRQQAAQASVAGVLGTVDREPAPAVAAASGKALQQLVDSGIDAESAQRLDDLYLAWIADPSDRGALAKLRRHTA
ncbi:MAG: hypothetical protein ACTHKG_19155, partial [Nocardioides sp.]